MIQNNSITVKHVLIRSIITLVLFALSATIGVLALLSILIETVYLYKKDNKQLAIINLKIIGFFVALIAIAFLIGYVYNL